MEQKHYLTKIVSFYNVYILDAWPGSSTNTFKFNNGLFGATNIAKKKVINKSMYIVDVHGVLVTILLGM